MDSGGFSFVLISHLAMLISSFISGRSNGIDDKLVFVGANFINNGTLVDAAGKVSLGTR